MYLKNESEYSLNNNKIAKLKYSLVSYFNIQNDSLLATFEADIFRIKENFVKIHIRDFENKYKSMIYDKVLILFVEEEIINFCIDNNLYPLSISGVLSNKDKKEWKNKIETYIKLAKKIFKNNISLEIYDSNDKEVTLNKLINFSNNGKFIISYGKH